MGKVQQYKRILVIATHCIGDSLLISSITHSLRRSYPEAKIDVLVTDRGRMVFAGNQDVDEVICIPLKPKVKDYLAMLKQYWKAYDLTVNEMMTDRTALYSLAFGRERLGSIDMNAGYTWLKKRIYQHNIAHDVGYEHKISRHMRMLREVGVDNPAHIVSPEAPLSDEVQSRLPNHYVVVHAPSSNTLKQWPVQYWVSLCHQMLEAGYYLVFSGAKSDRDIAIVGEITAALKERDNWQSLVGVLSLGQTSTLIKHSQGFVGPDSGPGHMASAYPLPIVSIISVAPASMWSPWPFDAKALPEQSSPYTNGTLLQTVNNISILQSERPCVPCYQNHCQISGEEYSPCLMDITPERVFDVVVEKIPLPVPSTK
ncbi:glycosyltransferase family 9 protein [Thaumasiovibrio subtropicus]|uniref:glycosyltransferase family 9 protein n=1 Tax=Thaumasiovibrio subtropicus TaxID=1891207 RepID=UPI000B35ACDE|nr:glycosyltransferase family 9 protein [Thaumasiovibrio subtropicus]